MEIKIHTIVFVLAVANISYGKPKNNYKKLEKKGDRIGVYHLKNGRISCGEAGAPPMKKVDPKTFRVIGGSQYAFDKNKVYFPISEDCVDTQVSGYCYCSKYVVMGAEPRSFRYLGKDYGVDRKRVFFRGEPIKSAFPSSFTVIGKKTKTFIAKDHKRVYWFDNILEQAKPTSFSIQIDKRGGYLLRDSESSWRFQPPNKPVKLHQSKRQKSGKKNGSR